MWAYSVVCMSVCMLQAGTEGGCVVLFDITPDGIVYSRSFTNLGGKHISCSALSCFHYYIPDANKSMNREE